MVDGEASTSFPITSGVPQGSILGPTLFILYTNDLEEHLPAGVEMAVYADDTTLHTAITVAENVNHVERTLQHAVDAVFDWGNKWCITFEPTKSQCMTITHKRVPWPHSPVTFAGFPVPEEDSIKLLGVVFDQRLSFRQHLRTLAIRANQRLAFMRKAAKVLDAHGLVSVYKGFVRPVLEYSPLVWSGAAPTHLSSLDKVQHRALKIIGSDTVLQSLRLRRTVSALSYLYKLQCIAGPPQLRQLVPPLAPVLIAPRTRRESMPHHAHQLVNELPAATCDTLRRSFPFAYIGLWNSLPSACFPSTLTLKSLPAFKSAVNLHLSHEVWAWDLV